MRNGLSNRDRQLLLRILRDLPDLRTVRGRQALVESAVGDYPKSTQLLGNLEWEGSATVFASDLLRWFDGYEIADGVETLPLLVSAIEQLVSAADRAALMELRQRQGWGTEPQAEPGEAWRDSRSPAELQLERIIDENTLRHVNMLRTQGLAGDRCRGAHLRARGGVRDRFHGRTRSHDDEPPCDRRRASGRGHGGGLLLMSSTSTGTFSITRGNQVGWITGCGDGSTNCTGFGGSASLDPPYIFVACPGLLRNYIDGGKRNEVIVGPAREGLAYTDPELDVSLVRLQDPPDFGAPLTLRPARLEQNQRVAIIQHPGGSLKKISLQNNFVAAADERLIQYYTSTEAGSSGSPVFDEDFRVVGLHRGYIELEETDPGERQFRNQGSSMIAILKDLETQVPKILKGLPILT